VEADEKEGIMKIQRTLSVSVLSGLIALVSCSGDENPSATPKLNEIRPATPPAAQAGASTRQPASAIPAATQLDPAPAPLAVTPAAPTPPATDPQVADPMTPQPADPAAAAEVADAEAPLLSPEEAAIPTQEEADLEASQSINDDNADEELEKLEKELGTEGGG
jgi:hypothetical protein